MIARLPDDPRSLKGSSYTPPKSYADVRVYDTIEYEDGTEKGDLSDFLSYY